MAITVTSSCGTYTATLQAAQSANDGVNEIVFANISPVPANTNGLISTVVPLGTPITTIEANLLQLLNQYEELTPGL